MDTNTLIDTASRYGVAGLAALVATAIAVRVLAPRMLRAWARRSMSEAEREVLPMKEALLRHGEIVDFLAPLKDFQRKLDRDEKKKRQLHWLSAYPSAVKAAQRRHRFDSPRLVTLARAQVKEAARHIKVATLPDNEQPANAGPEHFSVAINLNGKPKQKILALADLIESQLEVHDLAVDDRAERTTVRFIGHLEAPESRLTATNIGGEFFDEHPAVKLSSLPVALTEQGESFDMAMAHSIIYGVSGSGKGSAFQAIIRQMQPFIEKGEAQVFAIDPKNVELRPWAYSTLLSDYATGTDNISRVIADFHARMQRRAATVRLDWENADMKRSLPYTKETPLMLLMIDELFAMISSLQSSKAGKATLALLDQILAQGRSLGFVVIGATQIADTEIMKWMKPNIATWIVLRIKSTYFNDDFLGKGAAAQGYDATAIIKATTQNNYATAGLAFAQDASGDLAKIRFPYTDDKDMTAIIRSTFRDAPLGDAEGLSMADQMGEAWITEEHGPSVKDGPSDFDWSFEDVQDDKPYQANETDNAELSLPALD
jgi:hypothetical protein